MLDSTPATRIAVIATVIILLRQVVATLHGRAHDELGVGLEPWQQAFVMVVIVILPLVSLVMYWTSLRKTGALVLWTSMLAGMLFGIYFHFIAISSDHVNHLPEGNGQSFFITTAILLVPIEATAVVFGFWSWRRLGGKS